MTRCGVVRKKGRRPSNQARSKSVKKGLEAGKNKKNRQKLVEEPRFWVEKDSVGGQSKIKIRHENTESK